MKRAFTRATTSVVLTFLLASPAWAAGEPSIPDLKEQIKRLTLVERDPDTPAEVRELNRTFPAKRRAEPRDAYLKRIAALRDYLSTLLFSRKVFLENILACGNYEAMEGLYEGSNTKHRFSGKLRIFPSGVSTDAGRQVQMAPMFGVDLNAGRGPDQVRFFTGFAVRIRGLSQ